MLPPTESTTSLYCFFTLFFLFFSFLFLSPLLFCFIAEVPSVSFFTLLSFRPVRSRLWPFSISALNVPGFALVGSDGIHHLYVKSTCMRTPVSPVNQPRETRGVD